MLDNESYTIIGVMPRDFQFLTSLANVLIADRGITDPRITVRRVIGRLKHGVSRQAAPAELERMRPALAQSYPESQRRFRFRADPIGQRETERYRAAFTTLCAAVGLLALIACLNVADLIIARSVSRESEFVVHSAIGAGRTRLIRQVLIESLSLAAIGGAVGIALAWIGNRALVAILPAQYQAGRPGGTRIDPAVLWFALALTTSTAVLFGTGPAFIMPEVYEPYQQYLGPALGAMLVLRTQGNPVKMAGPLREAVHRAYPDQPISELAAMNERLSDSMAEPRLYTSLLAIFAAVALALTAIGVYRVIAYSVGRRTREFGIRMALGAAPADVLRVAIRGGLALVATGAAVGIAGAWMVTRYTQSMPLWSRAARPDHVCCGAPGVDHNRNCRLLLAREARNRDRSERRASRRVA